MLMIFSTMLLGRTTSEYSLQNTLLSSSLHLKHILIYTNLILLLFSYIEEDDMLRFMIKEEVELVLPLIEGAETGKITRKAFTEWVVSWNKFWYNK